MLYYVELQTWTLEQFLCKEFSTLQEAVVWTKEQGFRFNLNTNVVSGFYKEIDTLVMIWSNGQSVEDADVRKIWFAS